MAPLQGLVAQLHGLGAQLYGLVAQLWVGTGGTLAWTGGTFAGTGINGNIFDPAVATAGLYDISYTYTNAGGCDTAVTQSVEVTVCTGIGAKTNVSAINLFPNPNEGNFTLEFNANVNSALSITISDVTGKIVHAENASSVRGLNRVNLNVSNLQKGFYLLKTNDTVAEINKSFIIR